MKNYVETIYDTKSRPVTHYPVQLAEYLIQRFKIEKNSKILDNGCGRGDFLKAFEKCGLESYGTDLDAKTQIERGRKIVWGGINLEEDELPFPDDFFDIVFTKSVIEHLHKPSRFFEECYRVLKPEGRIIVMVPDWQSQMFIYYDDCTHVQPYTQTAVYDTLKIFGFQDVESEKFYQLPCVWKHKWMVIACKIVQLLGPVKKIHKNRFLRFSRELMLLGTGVKKR